MRYSELLLFTLALDLFTLPRRPRRITRTALEEREIEDTVAAIRLRTRHYDPYEEWEKATRKDAFVRVLNRATDSNLTQLLL